MMKEGERISVEVDIDAFAKANELNILYHSDANNIEISTTNINRPGLLLSGFESYFAETRIQVMGNAEMFYLETLTIAERVEALERLFSKKIPCVVISRGIMPFPEMMNTARAYNIPVYGSKSTSTELVNGLVAYLNDLLAPMQSCHGTLLDVNGSGVLIMGKSGIGKSETALELVHRGHRLVADDAVILKKVNRELIGTAPEKIRFFMEIRGIGIIDVRSMFGISSILFNKKVDFVIELEKWQENVEYDRIGMEENTVDLLGVSLPRYLVPVIPGRNLAIVIEAAARNFYLKKLGYNAAKILIDSSNKNRK